MRIHSAAKLVGMRADPHAGSPYSPLMWSVDLQARYRGHSIFETLLFRLPSTVSSAVRYM